MKLRGIKGLLFILLFISVVVKAQEGSDFAVAEDSLLKLSVTMWKSKDDSSRKALNNIFRSNFENVLSKPGSFRYPFDSLTGISRLMPEDSKFRIITWDLPLNDGTFLYFGFIQLCDSGLYSLKTNPPGNWINQSVGTDTWYGALYYQMVTVTFQKKKYYTLLGWNGQDQYTDRKMIDILTFEGGKPVFGGPYFKTAEGIRNRVVIDFTEKAKVTLRFDRQSYWISKGKRIREKQADLIVTDRLIRVPSGSGFSGRAAVPSGDTYDAYVFKDGFWTFVEDVNAKNHK